VASSFLSAAMLDAAIAADKKLVLQVAQISDGYVIILANDCKSDREALLCRRVKRA
jgi:hypothetical protein